MLGGDGFCLPHHAQHVQPRNFFMSSSDQPRGAAPPSAPGISRRPRAPRRDVDAVEVAADADVIDAGDLPDVIDVVGDELIVAFGSGCDFRYSFDAGLDGLHVARVRVLQLVRCSA